MDDGVTLISNTKRQIYIVLLDFNAKGFNKTWLSYLQRVSSVYVGYYQVVIYLKFSMESQWNVNAMLLETLFNEQLYTVEPV